VNPGFRGDVLGTLRGEHAQVTKESGIRIAPQDGELIFVATLGVRKHPLEVVAHHKLSICNQAAPAQLKIQTHQTCKVSRA
jgi:hypothetical protein